MKARYISAGLLVVMASLVFVSITSVRADHPRSWDIGHTRPDYWDKARIFHISPSHARPETDGMLSRVDLDQTTTVRVLSPNDAYWFGWNGASPADQAASPEPGTGPNLRDIRVEQERTVLYIYNERDYLIEIKLSSSPQRYALEVGWVSEKLVMIRFFDGQKQGKDILIDTERERIIYAECVSLGGRAYHQWQDHAAAREKAAATSQPANP